jgi:hypothetical protein
MTLRSSTSTNQLNFCLIVNQWLIVVSLHPPMLTGSKKPALNPSAMDRLP